MKSQKSFTLIELLVVISIIGLLSSIVAVNLKGVRKEAKTKAAMGFSQSVFNALGAYAVGVWRFEEADGSPVVDSSGYGNEGTPYGAVVHTTGIINSGLEFDGISDYVDVGNDASLRITDAITIELWANIQETCSSGYCGTLIDRICTTGCGGVPNTGGYGILLSSPNQIYLMLQKTGGGYITPSIKTSYSLNVWYHIAATYDSSSGERKLFINGTLKDSGVSADGALRGGNNSVWIGKGYAGYFDGIIDEVRIYDVALTVAEIQKHYAEGIERHKNLTIR